MRKKKMGSHHRHMCGDDNNNNYLRRDFKIYVIGCINDAGYC